MRSILHLCSKHYKKCFSLGVKIFLVAAMTIFWAWDYSNTPTLDKTWLAFDSAPAGSPPEIKILKSDTGEIELEVDFHGVWTGPVIGSARGDVWLQMPQSGQVADVGRPELPVRSAIMEIPDGTDITLEVADVQYLTLAGKYKVKPVPEPWPEGNPAPDPDAVERDEAIYSKDANFPEMPASFNRPVVLRGHRLLRAGLFPLRYNPVQEKLTATLHARIRIQFHPSAHPEKTSARRHPGDGAFKPLFDHFVLNHGVYAHKGNATEAPFNNENDYNHGGDPDGDRSYTPTGEGTTQANGADYLILVPDAFIDSIQPLADWKHKQGYLTHVTLLSDIGPSPTGEDIKAYLQNVYDTWNPVPTYVLFVGDHDTMPVSGTNSDLFYSTLDGDDYFPDWHQGRIPANGADIDIIVDKLVNYQRYPDVSGIDWYDDIMIAGYFQDNDNDSYADRFFFQTCQMIEDFVEDTKGYAPWTVYCTNSSNPLYYYYGDPIPSGIDWSGDTQDIIDGFNHGVWLVQHRDHGGETGWGDPPFYVSDVVNLVNAPMYPVVFSINCLTGDFLYSSDCFCEAMMKREGGGSVSIIGATEVSYSGYNDELSRGFFDAMWIDFYPDYPDTGDVNTVAAPTFKFGPVMNYGKFAMYDNYFMTGGEGYPWTPSDSTTKLEFRIFHAFGDPSLDMYSSFPQNLTVDHPDSIVVGDDQFDATVTMNGQPVEGALVSVMKQEDDFEVWESGYTDENGYVLLILDPATETPGDMFVTVTAHNGIPYEEICYVVVPEGPFLVHEDHSLDDSAEGNGDGIANPGENIVMPVTLKNVGVDNAVSPTGTLRTSSSLATIIDDYAEYPDIPVDGMGESLADHYKWQVVPGTADGSTIRFYVDWASGGYTEDTGFNVYVKAPILEYVSYVLDDASGGDGDGFADPAETDILLAVTLKNVGHAMANGVYATIEADSSYILWEDSQATWPAIDVGQEAQSTSPHFKFSIDPYCPEGLFVTFTLHIYAGGGYERIDQAFTILVGSHGNVLVIDDGGGGSPGLIADTLSDRAFYVEEATASSTDPTTWNDYTCVVWSSGKNSNPASNETLRNELENYVLLGGHLFIEGGELAKDHDTEHPTFAQNVLHIDSQTTNAGENLELVVPTHPISFSPNQMPTVLQHTYSSYGEDVCIPTSDASLVYQWSEYPGKGGLITYDDNDDADDGGQVVFFSFDVTSADSGGSKREDLIENAVTWLSTSYKLRYEAHTLDDSDPDYGNGDGIVDPGEMVTASVTVANNTLTDATDVTAVLTSDTPGVTIHTNYATYPNIPGSGNGTSYAPHFSFSTDAACGDRIIFNLAIYHDGNLTSLASFYVPIGERLQEFFFDDDMETDGDWTVTGSEGANGLWVEEDPYEVRDEYDALVQPEDDTTPDPGVRCWVTGNPKPSGNFDPREGDVDRTVTLFSPLFSAEGGENVMLHYQRFFYAQSTSLYDSEFSIAYSTNGGSSWTALETLTSSANSWQQQEFKLKNLSADMQLRFRVQEANIVGDLVLEGLVDDVLVDGYKWFCDQFTLPDANPPNPVGDTLMITNAPAGILLEWEEPPSDATHDPPTFYRVEQCDSASGTFVEVGSPTATQYYDQGIGECLFYKVYAENGGGSE